MSPFLQFRLWLRSAPMAERGFTAAALSVVAALLVWALVPGAGRSASSVLSLGGAPETGSGSRAGAVAAGSPATGGSGAAVAAGSGASRGPAAAGSAAGSSAGSPRSGGAGGASTPASGSAASGATAGAASGGGTGAGVGQNTTAAGCRPADKVVSIKLGLPILEIAGPAVNSAFNIPSPSEQQQDWTAILDAINASGGVRCHPLAADFQSMNPADNTSGQTDCLQFAQDRVFAVLGYLSANATPGAGGDLCVVQHGIPDFHPQAVPADETAKYFPYMFGMERTDVLFRNFALGAAALHQFDGRDGFTKLGVVYSECQPSLVQNFLADLAQAGVSGSRLETFSLGCPSGYAAPSTLAQAALQFKNDHVSTVTFEEPGDPDLPTFTRAASSQFYTPHYVLPDDGLLLDTDHNASGPDPTNFNGAVAITPNQYGALNNSPALPVSPATATCDAALRGHGLPDTEHSDGGVAGVDCDMAWLFVAGADHAPTLAQNQLAAGLQRAGSVPFSYPGGPTAFGASDSTTGGEYWRTVAFSGACRCWHVTTAAFRPSF